VYVAFVSATLAWQGGFIASATAIDERGDELSFDPVGAGPYYFDEWIQGERVTLKAHDAHYGDLPHFQTVELQIIPDETLAVLALEQGEIDVAPVGSIGAFRATKDNTALQISQAEASWQYWMYFETQQEPTNDVLVRQALAHASDLQAISDSLDGMIFVNPSYLSPMCLGWTDDITTYSYDLDRARELLAEAGYDDPGDLKIKMIYNKAFLYEEIAFSLQDMWSELGVDVSVENLDLAVLFPTMDRGEYNVAVSAISRLESDLFTAPFLLSTSASNRSHYVNPELDELIQATQVEMDTDRRAELYAQIQELVAQELPIYNAGTQVSTIASRPGISGIVPHPYIGLINFSLLTEA
jgi:ABC-type transport system substrate-binding protein